jgi:hypothetical protein
MNKRIPFLALLLQVSLTWAQSPTTKSQPSISFHKWLSITQAGAAVLSPDGANIAYTVTTTDWKENSYHNERDLAFPAKPSAISVDTQPEKQQQLATMEPG